MKVQLIKTATATVLTGAVARLANLEDGAVLLEFEDGSTDTFDSVESMNAAGFVEAPVVKQKAKRIPKEAYTEAIREMNEQGKAITAGGVANHLNTTTAAATRMLKSLGMERDAETGLFEVKEEKPKVKANGRKRAQA